MFMYVFIIKLKWNFINSDSKITVFIWENVTKEALNV